VAKKSKKTPAKKTSKTAKPARATGAAKGKAPSKIAKLPPKKAAPTSKPKGRGASGSKLKSSSSGGGGGGGGDGMRPVSTGTGASPMEVGSRLVTLFNAGQVAECEALWDSSIVSCEGVGVGLEWGGRRAVEAKNAEWSSKHTMLGGAAEGPFVGSTGFSVKFRLHVKVNETGAEMVMNEVGVYTVRDGKIVREEFMYGM